MSSTFDLPLDFQKKLMTKILPIFITAIVLSFCNVADADSIVQTGTVSTVRAGDLFDQDTGDFELFDDEFFSLTADPFDPSLGTLISATVSFTDLSVSVAGTGLDVADTGIPSNPAIIVNLSGQFTIGGVLFNGAGDGDFLPGEDGELLEFNLALPDFSQDFFVADAGLAFDDPNLVGTSFDPAVLDVITGDVPFEVLFNSAGPVSLFDVTDVVAEASATISIRYDFDPATVPEPSSALVGLLGLITMTARRRRVD